MKTALKLLGDVKPIEYDANVSSGGESFFRLTPNACGAWLELVAERAREEMRNACANAVNEQCRVFDDGSDAVPSLAEECIYEALAALPTHPDHAGKAGAR